MVEPAGQVLMCAGRQLHVRQHGGTEPAVVLMSGCGLAMEYWRGVKRLMPERRVIAYDRPGMGGTAWPGHLPSLAEEVDSLAALLDMSHASGTVLVAHSMASFHAEALTRLRPDLVSGVVMVDGSVEWYASKPTSVFDGVPNGLAKALRAQKLSQLGGYMWRAGTWLQSGWDFRRLGYGRIPAIYRDPDSLVMATAESIAYSRQAWDLQHLRVDHPWPDVAVRVLTAGRDEGWIGTQARYAELLHGQQVVVETSKHLMMLDAPETIVAAVDAIAAEPADATS